MNFATIDPWILAFSAITVIATVWVGFWSARRSKTAHDFYVAGRSVSVGWNASAISGEYLSAASFMGVAGMVMSSGYDALWYPVCYACGYLFLLLFIAGPLRRFGAYTIPDFAEGRFDSPLFRKIAVVFVLFIGFFYTMPQMKGAGTTLAYIFPGLPYWAGVVLVGAVITLNVALGGMKGITLVQAFQYWAKMFAISVPIFVLMAVYGHYGKQLGANDGRRSPGGHSLTNASLAESDSQVQDSASPTASTADLDGIHAPSLTLALPPGPIMTYGNAIEPPAMTNKFGPVTATVRVTSAGPTGAVDVAGLSLPLPSTVAAKLLPKRKSDFFDLKAGIMRFELPEKAPADSTWLSPFGPLTTKAAKTGLALDLSSRQSELLNTNRYFIYQPSSWDTGWRPSVLQRATRPLSEFGRLITGQKYSASGIASFGVAMRIYSEFSQSSVHFEKSLTNVVFQSVNLSAKSRTQLFREFETLAISNGVALVSGSNNSVWAVPSADAPSLKSALRVLEAKARPVRLYALLYTYSLIIALVCGTAGLPHILVRFYTNPDGVAAKRTTMWVMILIGVFYLFPPVFGVMGRNLMPQLYEGVGAKGTDKVVLELPRILNEHGGGGEKEQRGKGAGERGGTVSSAPFPPFSSAATNTQKPSSGIPWGSILSGITCAGAFAAFMSTFSGLLVSMTGALAHDVYGRMLRPKSTPQQRMRAFKICAVIVGAVAILLGMQVEPFQINFMVGQAFAIAAASYFPLLFMSAWWRGMTMRGAATGMLAGGCLALLGISLTSFSDLKWLPLDSFWAGHPLLRILCEQPAIWTVPLAITLMIVVSKMTRTEIPSDVRMKMLVLHAPEKLGLKQEYIQEHQHGH